MNYKFKTKPYAHQLKALEMSWNKEVFAYFMEMGTGKSKVLLDNVAMLFDKGKINSVLIVAPKGVYNAILFLRLILRNYKFLLLMLKLYQLKKVLILLVNF